MSEPDSVTGRAARGSFSTHAHGAHVTGWSPDSEPVIWLSRHARFQADEAIRGGIPICFPWFADTHSPSHGFVRKARWRLVEHEEGVSGTEGPSARVVWALTGADVEGCPGRELWPHAFTARCVQTFGTELGVQLEITNDGDEPFTFEAALHTYLTVGDVRDISITGLEGARYRDKTDGYAEKIQQGPITVTGETDRVYDSGAQTVVTDPVLGRTLVVTPSNAANTVVWNPWVEKAAAMTDFGNDEWTTMVCVETANVGEHALRAAPGETAVMGTVIGRG